MKAKFFFFAAAAAALLSFTACQKEVEGNTDSALTHKVSFIAEPAQSKTSAVTEDGKVKFSWTKYDENQFMAYEIIGGEYKAATEVIGNLNGDGTMSIIAEFAGAPVEGSKYQAVLNGQIKGEQADYEMYNDQCSSDLLVSEIVDASSASDGIMTLRFERRSALVCLKMNGLETGYLKTVVIETLDGKKLSGEYLCSSDSYDNLTNRISVTASYDVANASATFWTLPVENTSLRITATTCDEKGNFIADYQKDFAEGATISFPAGDKITFKVNMEKKQEVFTTIAQIKNALASGTSSAPVAFAAELEGAVVTYVNGINAFIEDESAGILYYGSGHGLKAGNVLSGTVEGAGYNFKGTVEITSLTTKPTITPGEAPAPKVVTLAELIDNYDAYTSRLVKIEGVTLDSALSSSSRTGSISRGSSTMAVYLQNTSVSLGANIYGDLTCTPGYHNTDKQLNIWAKEHFEIAQIAVTGISLDQTTLSVEAGRSAVLTATINPVNAANKSITWTSDDETVATVIDGRVKGVAEGTATITATTVDGGFTATCTVTVTPSQGGEPEKTYTIQFGTLYNSGGISAYDQSWSATKDGFKCNLENWNNNNNKWSYIKGGSKKAASVCIITTAASIPEAICKVVMTVDAVTASSINSIKLEVLSDANVIETVNATSIKTGDMTFSITAPTNNCTYKISVDAKKGSSNGLIQVSKVTYSNF